MQQCKKYKHKIMSKCTNAKLQIAALEIAELHNCRISSKRLDIAISCFRYIARSRNLDANPETKRGQKGGPSRRAAAAGGGGRQLWVLNSAGRRRAATHGGNPQKGNTYNNRQLWEPTRRAAAGSGIRPSWPGLIPF